MKRNEKKRKIIAHRLDFESANLFRKVSKKLSCGFRKVLQEGEKGGEVHWALIDKPNNADNSWTRFTLNYSGD